jgi:hypothetical protein
MRRLVPVFTVALLVAVLVACGSDGNGSTEAFCDSVGELRKLGREPGSTEPADPQLLEATIAGLRKLERAAPSQVKGDVETIRDALETIASLGAGKRVDPKKVEQLAENDQKIRDAGKSIDRQVEKCGIKVPST